MCAFISQERRKNEYGYRSGDVCEIDGLGRRTLKEETEEGHDATAAERRDRVFCVCPLGLEVITEIDAHPSDPSCSLHMDERMYIRVRVRLYNGRRRRRLQSQGTG